MPYAEPKTGLTLNDCAFYHRMDIPAARDKEWLWDLLGDEGRYLGGFDFSGKRVLEIGPANGGLTFWMERQGAEVVSADLSPDTDKHSWDVLWRPTSDKDATFTAMKSGMTKLNNSWWYARSYFDAKARFVYATAYDTPEDIGSFDVVTLAAILLHLRDPMRALENVIRFTRKWIVISEVIPLRLTQEELKRPLAVFVPAPNSNWPPHGGITWWHMSPELFIRYLDIKGFDIESMTTGDFRLSAKQCACYSIVAKRR
jgi:SAM-dependent methyltransferase